MWVLMLEAFVALFLLVFIVWWTLPSKKKKPAAPARQESLPKPAQPDGAQADQEQRPPGGAA